MRQITPDSHRLGRLLRVPEDTFGFTLRTSLYFTMGSNGGCGRRPNPQLIALAYGLHRADRAEKRETGGLTAQTIPGITSFRAACELSVIFVPTRARHGFGCACKSGPCQILASSAWSRPHPHVLSVERTGRYYVFPGEKLTRRCYDQRKVRAESSSAATIHAARTNKSD